MIACKLSLVIVIEPYASRAKDELIDVKISYYVNLKGIC